MAQDLYEAYARTGLNIAELPIHLEALRRQVSHFSNQNTQDTKDRNIDREYCSEVLVIELFFNSFSSFSME